MTQIRITTGAAIREAYQQALVEKAYRECRVYGMGKR